MNLKHNGFDITFYDEVSSTNDLLMQEGREGAESGKTAVARRQTKGKGSKGRSFYSPPSGIYLSVLVRPSLGEDSICPGLSAEEALLITPAVACAVADTLEKVSGRRTGIKWVNDIYLDGRKVCGILTESGQDCNLCRFYVIGIGINLAPPPGGFPEEFARTATALFDSEPSEETRLETVLSILENINNRLNEIPDRKFLSDYRKRSVLIGKKVTVNPLDGREPYPATVTGIDENARLEVRREDGSVIKLNSEEVKVVL